MQLEVVMRTRFFIALMGCLALTATPLMAQKSAKAPLFSSEIPKYSIGAFANVGYGSQELTVVPGLVGSYGDYQAGLHFGMADDMLQLDGNIDYLAYNKALKGMPLSAFGGLGVYGVGAIDKKFKDDPIYGAGFRGVVGARTMILGMLEANAALVPAVGAVYADSDYKLNWSVGLEISLRYAVLRKSGMVLTTEPSKSLWTPDGDGVNDKLGLAVKVIDDYRVASWTFDVTDPMGKPFFTQKGNTPLSVINWNGLTNKGERVVAMQNYGYTLTVTDSDGISKQVSGTIPVDLLLIKDGNNFKLDLTGFLFKPDSPDLLSDAASAQENARLLAALKNCLTKMKQYDVTIVGHAINISGTQKEEGELTPLSVARAETIKSELKALGLDTSSIKTAGKGGTQPIVPNTDLDNRWKNRRVEFLMTPKGVAK
jgi:outer membrane protein OmpA-like peptidoglycan-associated protein